METKNISNRQRTVSVNRTKKRQTPQLTALEKAKLWAAFDNDTEHKSSKMECIYNEADAAASVSNIPVTDVCEFFGVSRTAVYAWFLGKSSVSEKHWDKMKKLVEKLR